MSYYPTIDEDLKRAREILERGWVDDTYPTYKLLESFVAEIERLQEVEHKLGIAATSLGQMWKETAAEAVRLRADADTTVHPSTVTDQPGHPVAAPCTISYCQYFDLTRERRP